MGISWAWLKTPKGILKVFALVLNVLALVFFIESVGVLKPPEYRLFFITTGGYLLIMIYRIIGFIFDSERESGPQEAVADVVGALLLITLAVLIIIRAITEDVLRADFSLLVTAAACGCVAGLILAVDAFFVMK